MVANFATRGSENTFVQIEQLQGGDYAYATALGTANNLVVNLPSTYTTDSWDLKAPIVITPIYNNTGAVTIQLILGGMAIGTFPVCKDNKSQLVRNDIIAGIPFTIILDKSKTFFNIITGNYLSLTGGTVTGDTNFTAKLQNKSNDVTTIDQFDSKKETNGYQKLPGGLIMQWGTIEHATNNTKVYFKIPFDNLTLSISVTDANGGTACGYMNPTKAGFIFRCYDAAENFSFSYVALGY